ncbi:hypothetical protein [Chromobacterium sp. IIBBL 290-4]|uniref:hypothetical protein n=1 Tax=Chromobacterium sp. IIBBL 290-4 TaxID=2953890 RepID=UPI0020B7E9EE|nr:hypothetical protein [Chromobacterium sp. IIBBL 290-4]UTH76407.1 hypothetical protein NKT35_10010 [Chromobacterium sp. IIBBL 290-4]
MKGSIAECGLSDLSIDGLFDIFIWEQSGCFQLVVTYLLSAVEQVHFRYCCFSVDNVFSHPFLRWLAKVKGVFVYIG